MLAITINNTVGFLKYKSRRDDIIIESSIKDQNPEGVT